MATQAESVVSVQSYSDPSEVRLKDDQAIILATQKDVPILTYITELNKYVKNDNSFLFVSRISGERLCVVLDNAALASMLVEQVVSVSINDAMVPIEFLTVKSVKVSISNAGISNLVLKKFLTNDCRIRTASSVSELKANFNSDGSSSRNVKSFRKVIYIHQEDVSKLPKGLVKFSTSAIGFNVFFDIENPKCFLCSSTGHYKINCPLNKETFTLF